MQPKQIRAHIDNYIHALEEIAKLPKRHKGDIAEREQNDMEDAFSNGIDVGRFEALQQVAAIAKNALRGKGLQFNG